MLTPTSQKNLFFKPLPSTQPAFEADRNPLAASNGPEGPATVGGGDPSLVLVTKRLQALFVLVFRHLLAALLLDRAHTFSLPA
jgi:hypothetical protein